MERSRATVEQQRFGTLHAVVTCSFTERLKKRPVEPDIAGHLELFDADHNTILSGNGLVAACPE
jgi:hypothetical protein